MTLEYLWIDKFRVLKEIGFNFSSKFNYNYDPKSKVLSRSENKLFIESFFSNDFNEITALIGENGVGKSSLFEFILRNLSNFYNGGAVYNDDGDFFAVFNNVILYKGLDPISNKEELEYQGYNIIEYSTNNLFLSLVGTGYEHLSYIYYSNVFDYKKDYGDSSNLLDISTDNLLIEDSRNANQELNLYMFVNNELKRQIDFFANIDFSPPFKLPNKLFIEISKNVYKYKHLITDEELVKRGLANIVQICSLPDPYQPHDKAVLRIYKNLLKYRSYNNAKLYSKIKAEKLSELLKDKFHSLSSLTEKQQVEFTNIKAVYDNYWNLVSEEVLRSDELESGFYLEYSLRVNNSHFYDFLNSINFLLGLDTFFYFTWDGLSSGEKALLSVFSRLFYARKQQNENEKKDIVYPKNDLIIMIDECDLYLHPEWQQNLFYNFHKTLPKIFSGQKIQLILSSHSPFIVSDLPNSNIIFLKKALINPDNSSSGFRCKIENKFQKTTFGSNIHSLFIESFFMSKGLIGTFSREKIFELIKDLENLGIPNDDEVIELKKRINVIGEPMIRQKLFEILYKKVGNDDTRRRREFLENELSELNRIRKQKNHEEG